MTSSLGRKLAPGMDIGYVIRDARKWEVDPERAASRFDAVYYRGLLEKAWGEATFVFSQKSYSILLRWNDQNYYQRWKWSEEKWMPGERIRPQTLLFLTFSCQPSSNGFAISPSESPNFMLMREYYMFEAVDAAYGYWQLKENETPGRTKESCCNSVSILSIASAQVAISCTNSARLLIKASRLQINSSTILTSFMKVRPKHSNE